MTFPTNNVIHIPSKSSDAAKTVVDDLDAVFLDDTTGRLMTAAEVVAEDKQQAAAGESVKPKPINPVAKLPKTPEAAKRMALASIGMPDAQLDGSNSLAIQFTDTLTATGDYVAEGRDRDTGKINRGLWKWDGEVWKPYDQDELQGLAQEFCRVVESDKTGYQKAKALVDFCVADLAASTSLPTMAKMEANRGERVIIGTKGQYVELVDGSWQVIPVDKNLGMTFSLPDALPAEQIHDGVFTPNPELPADSKWKSFLDFALPNKATQDYLAELMAASLMTKCYQAAGALVGDGNNGKSIVFSMLRTFHARPESFNLAGVLELGGLSQVSSSTLLIEEEAPSKLDKNATDIIKKLISRNPVRVRHLYSDPVTVKPRAMLWASMNTKLVANDTSTGWTRRFQYIPFLKAIPAKQRVIDYEKQLVDDPKERAAVRDWIFVAACRLAKRGELPKETPEMKALKEDTKVLNDSVYAWFTERELCAKQGVARRKADFYKDFRNYARENGRSDMSDARFWDRVRAILREREQPFVQTRGQRHQDERGVMVRDWMVNLCEDTDADIAAATPWADDEPLPFA